MDSSYIKCEHPTQDHQGNIQEKLDFICIKEDCSYDNRGVCDHCRLFHNHNDQIIRLDKVASNLRDMRPQIETEAQKANDKAISIMAKKEKLQTISENLHKKLIDRQLLAQQNIRNNLYFQLGQIIDNNEIQNSKKEIQRLGEILRKTTNYHEGQLQLIETPVYELDFTPLINSLNNCVDDFFQQIESSKPKIVQIVPEQGNNFIQNSIFKFNKKMAYYSQEVNDKKVIAGAGNQQVTLITPNLSQLEQSLLSIKVDFNGGTLEGGNQNRIGLFFGNTQNFKFKYDNASKSQFILVGDDRMQYIRETESDCDFCIDDGMNRLKLEYDKTQQKLNISNEKNSKYISIDAPQSQNCYFCFIINLDATVEII